LFDRFLKSSLAAFSDGRDAARSSTKLARLMMPSACAPTAVRKTNSSAANSLVTASGSEVPVPPPSCLNCAKTRRYTSAITQVPITR
jgi:hypothetical protein